MIFNLPPILGFIPLILYIVLSLKGVNIIIATVSSLLTGAVLTGQSLLTMGTALQSALGEFITLIGFIILLGAGLGEILKCTGVAQNIVYLVLNKLQIKTVRQSLILATALSGIMTALLGTSSGANATICPIILPIVASIGVVPGALSIMLMAGATAGMAIGPFTPITITITGLSGLSYVSYLASIAVPLALVILIPSFFMALRLQKRGGDGEKYTDADMTSSAEFISSPEAKRGTFAFFAAMTSMILYGIYAGAGASYAIIVMAIVSAAVGIASGMKPAEFINTYIEGCARMFQLFLLFVLFAPFLNFVVASGAFDALVGYLQPLINIGGEVAFLMLSACVGIFGIAGAAVAQAQIINELFAPIAAAMNIDMGIWGTVIAYGCILTSFAMPNPDNLGPMGLAHSKNLKAMIQNGYVVITVGLAVLLIRTVIYVMF